MTVQIKENHTHRGWKQAECVPQQGISEQRHLNGLFILPPAARGSSSLKVVLKDSENISEWKKWKQKHSD